MKRTWKQLLALCLTLLMMTLLTVPAAADIIYEPEDNFYKTHAEDCEYNSYRRYLTNGEAGYVYLYKNPESDLTVQSYPNGETIAISFLYTSPEGEVWGIVSGDAGWFDMSQLSLIYDSQAFLEDNKDKCVPYTQGSYTIEASEEKPVRIWAYPGGEMDEMTFTWNEFIQSVQMTYTDEAGNVWGHIGYARGIRNVWVCLTDPYSDTVGGYALDDHEITLRQEPVPAEDIPVSDSNFSTVIIAGVLIVVVVIGTAVLIRMMFVKKNKK